VHFVGLFFLQAIYCFFKKHGCTRNAHLTLTAGLCGVTNEFLHYTYLLINYVRFNVVSMGRSTENPWMVWNKLFCVQT